MQSPRVRLYSLLLLGALISISFFVRMEMLSATVVRASIIADAREYFAYAYNLRHHQVYSSDIQGLPPHSQQPEPDALRSPGYPIFLSFFMGEVPNQRTLFWIFSVQVLISTFTVWISYSIYKRFLQRGWAEFAAILTAVSPHLVAMNIYLLSETLFCFVLCGAAWTFTRFVQRPSSAWSLILGAILGLANLTRPSLLFFPLLLSSFILWQFKSRQRAKWAMMVVIGFTIVMAPWHIRNLVMLDRWSDDRLQISFLHHGMYPDFMYNSQEESYGFPYRFDPRSAEITQNTMMVLNEIADRFLSKPAEHAFWYLVKKPMAFWSWDIVQGQGDVFVYAVSKTPYWDQPIFEMQHGLMRCLHAFLVLSGLFGCVLVWFTAAVQRLNPLGTATARFISLVLIYYTALHMLGFPEPRYSIPLRPFLYGMSLFAVRMMWVRLRFSFEGRNAIQVTAVHEDGNPS
jgi:hypothetical protein